VAFKLPSLKSIAANLLVVLLAVVFVIALLEVAFRLVNFDFDRQEEGFKAIPIFFRQPTVPIGEIFYRRPGPDVWQGQVLAPGLRVAGGLDDAYRDEAAVTIAYDRLGFRNSDALTDWDVVVVGDSFVELGFLQTEDLFTTQVAQQSGLRVKNLGVSFSGPLTYNFLLKEYGKAEHTRHAMMVFYEGNDVIDLMREREALQKYQATGARDYRVIMKQNSFGLAMYRRFLGISNTAVPPKQMFQNSVFLSAAGEIPFTVSTSPPGKRDLSPEQTAALSDALAAWARIAKDYGMQPWLVYLPSKRRVFDGHYRLTAGALRELINRAPSDLPEYIHELSDQHGIRFVDVTAALVEETEKGNLTYNPIWDAHLNARGSRIVARVIAQALKEGK